MKVVLIALSLALASCANAPIRPVPMNPYHESGNGDIRVRVPHSHNARRERADGAAACAQYGRISVPAGNHGHKGRDYDCIDPRDQLHVG